ncbi:MAG: class I SAM-dependent DNA methyltransferase [Bacteroidaceae bacterium]|nr:class I SAM-dependent DNA methyltransferase [Bacteroidaceae bacterium]
MSDFVQQQNSISDFNSSDSWVILSPIEQSIKHKIEAVGTPLKDWDIQINYGIKTGFNDAFIISTEKRNEILANCKTEDERQRTEELIRPILRGRDIKRYGYVDNGLYLINTHNGVRGRIPRIKIEDYPAVKAHLDQYWDRIATRADKGDTPYNLRNCAYLEDFFKPKITWGNLNLEGTYSYAPEGMFINAPSPFIATTNIAILHILNSKIADYYIRFLGVTRNGGYFEYKPMFVEKLPVPQTGLDRLMSYPKQPSQKQEQEMASIIYQLYGLSEQEIDFLKNREF